MDVNDAQKAVNPEKKEKNKTIATIATIVILLIVGIIILIPKNKKNEPTAQEKPTNSVDTPPFFEERNQPDNNYTNPEELFVEEQVSRTKREELLNESQNQSQFLEPLNRAEAENQKLREEIQRIKAQQKPSFGSSQAAVPKSYQAPYHLKKRLSQDYQAIVAHFRKTRDYSWKIGEGKYTNLLSQGEKMARVEKPLQQLYPGAKEIENGFSMHLATGSRISAITQKEVSSDYPGLFTARVVRPSQIKDAVILCKSGPLVKKRIPVTIEKLTLNDRTYQLAGQVQMRYPGMEGDFHSRWYKRLGPELINTAIGAGFLAYTIGNQSGDRIDTRDAIAGPIIQESVDGVQGEISRMGGDVPNVVTVPQGTMFDILLSENLEIQL